MAFHYSRIIPKPLRDFVQRQASRYQQRGKGAPHRVRCNPFKALRGHVLIERSGEVVSVTVFSVGYIGPKHEWVSWPIGFKELQKRLGKGDRTFFPVFEIDRACLAQMQEASVQVKPERARLNDLVLP